MDKSFLDITGCKSSFEPILRQKSSRGLGENRKKRRNFRKPAFEFAVSKGSGKQYCMQFIPLAVLKLRIAHDSGLWHPYCMQFIPLAVLKHHGGSLLRNIDYYCMQFIPLAVLKLIGAHPHDFVVALHAIHTACGIETQISRIPLLTRQNCMQFIPLAVLKLHGEYGKGILKSIACNSYRLRY